MGVLDSIGNTPLVRLESLNPNQQVTVLAKLEGNNAGGSVKDRIALAMIRDAERAGKIKKGDTILEATSGNTGIGLAMVGAALGYKVVLTMPECVSTERPRNGEADRIGHRRGHPARPRRPVPKHVAFHVRMRQVSTVSTSDTVTSPLHCHRSSSSGLFFRTSHHRSATPA